MSEPPMKSIRFKHGAAIALVALSAFSILAAATELASGVGGVRYRSAIVGLVLGVVGFVLAGAYLWRTLGEAELPDKAYDELGLDPEE